MNKESLKILREFIIKSILEYDNPKVSMIDKIEIALNENSFLSEDNYENNKKVLQKELNKKKYYSE